MKIFISIIVVLTGIIVSIVMPFIYLDLATWIVLIPIYLVGLYFILKFSYDYLYKRNINNKINNKKFIKLLDTNLFESILNIGYGLLLIIYIGIVVLPVVTYPNQEFYIDVDSNIENFDIEDILIDIENNIDTDDDKLYFGEDLVISFDVNKEVYQLDFRFDIFKDGEKIPYYAEYIDGSLVVTHKMNYKTQASFGYKSIIDVKEILINFDSIDYDELINYYDAADNQIIQLRLLTGLFTTGSFSVIPTDLYKVVLYEDNTYTEIESYYQYMTSDYFMILTDSLIQETEYSWSLIDKTYMYVVKYE